MACQGDSFRITLSFTHLGWGSYRFTNSRGIEYGEGYIPIPASCARSYNLFNSNNCNTGLGYNEFRCTSTDGFFSGIVKTSGCSNAGNIYAKNLHGSGNLKALGCWFAHMNATVGDEVIVTWTSSTDLVRELIHNT